MFLARQPILDVKQRIRAYEILYRSGYTNHYLAADPDEASSIVVLDTFQHLGLDSLTGGSPAFINFSSRLLEMDIATLFPARYLVIELLETVDCRPEVLQKCRELKALGYTIALDDFVYSSSSEALLGVSTCLLCCWASSLWWCSSGDSSSSGRISSAIISPPPRPWFSWANWSSFP